MRNFDNSNNKNFISRKTKRKMMRNEKKNKKNFFYKNKNDKNALKLYKEKEFSFKDKLYPDKHTKNDYSKNNIKTDNNNQKRKSQDNKTEKGDLDNLSLNESMEERINNFAKNTKDLEIDSDFDDEIDSDIASLTSNEDEISENLSQNDKSVSSEEIKNSQSKNNNLIKNEINNKNHKVIKESINMTINKNLNELEVEDSEVVESEEFNNESDNEEIDNPEEWEEVSDEDESHYDNEKMEEPDEENEKSLQAQKKQEIYNYEGFDEESEASEDLNNNENFLKKNKDLNYMNALQPNYDELDDEIKKLEKKLGISKKDKYEKLKKKVASENYDEDLFDFLDEIDDYVLNKKETSDALELKNKKTPILNSSNIKNNIKNETKNPASSKKIEKAQNNNYDSASELSFPKESLDEIKAKSKLFNKSKISEEQLLKNQLNKDIIAILNRISEGNLSFLVKDFISKLDNFEMECTKISDRKNALISIYEVATRNCLKSIADQIITNITISSCIATYVSILHFKYGNSFMLYFVKTLIDNFNANFDCINKSIDPIEKENNFKTLSIGFNKAELKNLTFLLIQFYLYGNLTAKLYYDLIKKFIENFNDISSELLLLLLNYLGIELRKEDPESLKDIFRKINARYNSFLAQSKLIQITSVSQTEENNKENLRVDQSTSAFTGSANKIKYIVEMIEEIKNNKFMKFNMNEKFNFFKNFVNNTKKNYTQENYNLSSEKIADKIEIGLDSIKNFDKTKLQDHIEDGNENAFKVNDFVLENVDDLEIDDNIFCNNKTLEAKMQKLKLTTDLKKKIFRAIVGATDFIDAYERLNRLNLKKDQARDIIKIIILLVGSEKKYNQFYKHLLERLMEFDKDHKYTFHYTIWDNMKIMKTFKEQKIDNIAKLTSELLVYEKIALPVFLHFEFEEASKSNKLFVLKTFNYFFSNKKSECEKIKILFAKLVKNDDHVEFAKRLFSFLKNDLRNSKIVNFDNKTQEFIDKFNSALKVLSRVL